LFEGEQWSLLLFDDLGGAGAVDVSAHAATDDPDLIGSGPGAPAALVRGPEGATLHLFLATASEQTESQPEERPRAELLVDLAPVTGAFRARRAMR